MTRTTMRRRYLWLLKNTLNRVTSRIAQPATARSR